MNPAAPHQRPVYRGRDRHLTLDADSGSFRQAEREQLKAKANEAFYADLPPPARPSRQVLRRPVIVMRRDSRRFEVSGLTIEQYRKRETSLADRFGKGRRKSR